jgi:hypothetical protein
MEPRSGTIVVATADVSPAFEVPGALRARRFEAVDGGPAHMALFEVASAGVRDSREWAERVRPDVGARVLVYRQIFPAEGIVRGTAWGDGATAVGGLVMTRTDVAPENERDYNAWYDEEHLFTLCKVPGVISARRFKAVEGAPPYLALYELVAPEVQATEPWQAANRTPWAVRARGAFTTRWRTVYRPRPG